MMTEQERAYANMAAQTNAIRPNVKPSDTAFSRVAEARHAVDNLFTRVHSIVDELAGEAPPNAESSGKPGRPGLLGEAHDNAEIIMDSVGRIHRALDRLNNEVR